MMTHEKVGVFRELSLILRLLLFVLGSTLIGLGPSPAGAQPAASLLIPFQGRITDASGNASTSVSRVTFTIWDEPTGGRALWSEPHESVSIIAGQINVLLGSLTPLDDPNKDGNTADAVCFAATTAPGCGPKYLGITIGADTNQEMVPRHELVPAFHARVADAVRDGGVTANMLQDGAITAAKVQDGAITAGKLGPGAVTSDALALQPAPTPGAPCKAITGNNICNGTIKGEDIATGADGITGANIVPGSITEDDLVAHRYFAVATGSQSVPASTNLTAVIDTLEVGGNAAMFDGTNHRLVAQRKGVYIATLIANYDANAGVVSLIGSSYVAIQTSDGTLIAGQGGNGDRPFYGCAGIVFMNVGDWVNVTTRQDNQSAAAKTVTVRLGLALLR